MIFLMLGLINVSLADKINNVASDMGVSVSQAENILKSTYTLIKEIQGNFTRIANHDYSHEQKITKNGLINNTIKFFSSAQSEVEVSSLNTRRVNIETIYNYLHRLSNMSKKNTYKTIKLDFGKKIFIRDVFKENGNISISADAFQLFEGCKISNEGERFCYTDITKKTFVVKIESDLSGFSTYVDRINVKETLSFDDNKNIIEIQ